MPQEYTRLQERTREYIYMGVQRQYKGVEGRCRRVQGYMGVQRQYKGVEGICTVIYGRTKTIQGSRG